MEAKNNIVYLSLGSNIGDRKSNLETAISRIAEFAKVTRQSSIYESEPVDYKEQPDFLNTILSIKTSLSPAELIVKLQEIEHLMGRKKDIPKGPRNIDIDIIFYNNEIIEEKNLKIPHPRFSRRNFVLTPMAEIDPTYTDPLSHKTIEELKETLIKPARVNIWI